MARRASQFTTIRSEGGLLPSDLLVRVARLDSSLPGVDATSYWLDPGDRIAEAITRSWNRLLGAWETFSRQRADAKQDDPIVGLTRDRWLWPLFDELGWGRPVRAEESSHERGAVPIHLLGANVPLDRRTPNVPGAAKHSPHTVVQDLLNRSDDKLWGVVSNGVLLRLLRDNTSMTRQAFVEFDLEAMFAGEVYADFVVLWLACHCSRFDAERPAASVAEQWTREAQSSGVRALAQLRSGVEEALVQLGGGFLAHRANVGLRERLASRGLTTQDFYRQLLRLVYRLLFLCCAEDRGLLQDPDASPLVRETYAAHYSTARLRERARRRGTEHTDLWHTLRIVMRSLRDGCVPLGLPPLGSMLWSDAAVSDLDSAVISNRWLLAAVRALSFTVDGRTLRPVDWRNLGSEELGSVYESLLELHPKLDGSTFTLDTAAGHERKVTGSYYTPTSLITELLDSALDPVLAEARTPEEILALKVCDPACGSGHFLIAAAHRIARRLAMARTGEPEPAPDAVRTALRDVIGHCIYGVDVNEMAVELCKVSLWLEALEPGKPLSFLDHRIACGNSLLGTTPRLIANGIPDDAYKPITGDERDIASAWRKRNAAERKGQETFGFGTTEDAAAWLAAGLAAIEAVDDSTPEGVREKEQRWAALQESRQALAVKLVADAWCAAFVMPKVKGAPVVTTGVVRQTQTSPERTDAALREAVAHAATRYRFLHWQLAFPDVFALPEPGEDAANREAGWNGGFDVVCGNPPWDLSQFEEKQFFSQPYPDIANAAGDRRKRMIAALAVDDPDIYAEYRNDLRVADASRRFMQSSDRFPLTARGRVNVGAVFAEAMLSVLSTKGRLGVVLPTGVATDDATKEFFATLVETHSLVSLYDFENRRKLFPSVDSRLRFCLLTAAHFTGERNHDAMTFVFFATEVADLRDPDRLIMLSAGQISVLNPNTKTAPTFRRQRDASITLGIYSRTPVLRSHVGHQDAWGVEIRRLFNVGLSDVSRICRTAGDLEDLGVTLKGNRGQLESQEFLPVYQAKMIGAYDHRAASVVISSRATIRQAQPESISPQAHQSPEMAPQPLYWLPATLLENKLSPHWKAEWLVAWRDVTSASNERTVVAAILPRVPADFTVRVGFLREPDAQLASVLVALLNSCVVDYCARQKLGGVHLSDYITEQLPLPHPLTMAGPVLGLKPSVAAWIAERVLELSYTSVDLTGFARDLGYTGAPFGWIESRREILRAELDACFFHLYGLARDEVDYVMDTFPIVRRKDEAVHGDFRTKRLILESYDSLSPAVTASGHESKSEGKRVAASPGGQNV